MIMNCLNCEQYLIEAIDSVYAQTYDNWEIICPWAQIMVGTTMPAEVTENMIELTDEILERKNKEDYGERLAGQIENEFGKKTKQKPKYFEKKKLEKIYKKK